MVHGPSHPEHGKSTVGLAGMKLSGKDAGFEHKLAEMSVVMMWFLSTSSLVV